MDNDYDKNIMIVTINNEENIKNQNDSNSSMSDEMTILGVNTEDQ